VSGADEASARKTEELTEIIRQIQERVRARHPTGAAGGDGAPVPDLTPLLHARDAAESKVAAIGTVNPRPPGPLNSLVQFLKRLTARVLDWHVREQVEFNRAVMSCVTTTLEAFNETNRTLAQLAAAQSDFRSEFEATLGTEVQQLKDIRSHWVEWRREWEQKLATNEIQFLRSVADLQTAFQHRVTQMEGNFRDLVRSQHADFTTVLEKSGLDIQKRLWEDLERIRGEYERLIHNELRVVRQRASLLVREQPAEPAIPPALSAPGAPLIDHLRFSERFRGSEDHVKRSQEFYLEKFRGCRQVLDIGCGRGEFLEVMKEAGIPARGIDLSEEFVALCRQKGLDAEKADLFAYLDALDDGSLDGIFCAQVVEHLPPERAPEMIRLAAAKLSRDGRLAIETPNPECLAIFASHFYLDPAHTRPVPPSLMVFYLEEFGFGRIEVHRFSPAVESMPALAELPGEFREAFFGGLDYAVLARR
jgi:O-antigen chain-terminating methyltransferase